MVAIALFALIWLVFGVLALLFLRQGHNDAPSIASEATLTLLRRVAPNQASSDVATQATSRPGHGSR